MVAQQVHRYLDLAARTCLNPFSHCPLALQTSVNLFLLSLPRMCCRER